MKTHQKLFIVVLVLSVLIYIVGLIAIHDYKKLEKEIKESKSHVKN